jgi:hypothetical protein
MSVTSRFVAFVALLLSGACATARVTAGRHVDQSILTQEQLEERHFENLLVAVQTLRANWLNDRGPDSFVAPSHIWVYLDNTRLGGVQTLAQLGTRNISLVQKLNGVDATARWGIGHSAGVIAVMTWPPQNDPTIGAPPPPVDSTAHTD